MVRSTLSHGHVEEVYCRPGVKSAGAGPGAGAGAGAARGRNSARGRDMGRGRSSSDLLGPGPAVAC